VFFGDSSYGTVLGAHIGHSWIDTERGYGSCVGCPRPDDMPVSGGFFAELELLLLADVDREGFVGLAVSYGRFFGESAARDLLSAKLSVAFF